jgi:hypothetical protein
MWKKKKVHASQNDLKKENDKKAREKTLDLLRNEGKRDTLMREYVRNGFHLETEHNNPLKAFYMNQMKVLTRQMNRDSTRESTRADMYDMISYHQRYVDDINEMYSFVKKLKTPTSKKSSRFAKLEKRVREFGTSISEHTDVLEGVAQEVKFNLDMVSTFDKLSVDENVEKEYIDKLIHDKMEDMSLYKLCDPPVHDVMEHSVYIGDVDSNEQKHE